KAKVDIDAKSFAINLGQNESELVLHFNPRFDSRGDIKTIICNSKTCGEWGTETRKSIFPFQQGEEFKVRKTVEQANLTSDWPRPHLFSGEELVFPNRLQMDTVEYFSIDGDVKIKSVRFD
uniref:Galectin n=1 Tax=Pseudonaja textilis TaxID=8673 RepID=A0A670ZR85_PSETE